MLLPQDLYVTDEVYRLVAKGKAFREAGEKRKKKNEFSSFSWLCRRLLFFSFHKKNIFRQLIPEPSSTQPIPVVYLTLQGYKASTDGFPQAYGEAKEAFFKRKAQQEAQLTIPKKMMGFEDETSFLKKKLMVPFKGRTVFHFVFFRFKMLLI